MPFPAWPIARAMEYTCAQLCLAYIEHARRIYRRPDGTPTRQVENVKLALRDLCAQYGEGDAARAHSSSLLAVRSGWIARGLTRTTINARIRIVAAAFEWAADAGLIPQETAALFRTIRTLKRGQAAEGKGVEAISPGIVLATIPHLPPALADMVRILMLTGCRVGEAREARSDELYRFNGIWALRPRWHKTARHGCSRSIVLPHEAHAIIEPRLDRLYFFGPGDGSRPYHRDAVIHAIYDACDKAGVARWSPGRIRHTAATAIYEAHGLEAARVLLGHTTDRVTRIYVHATDERKASLVVASLPNLMIHRTEAIDHGNSSPQARAG